MVTECGYYGYRVWLLWLQSVVTMVTLYRVILPYGICNIVLHSKLLLLCIAVVIQLYINEMNTINLVTNINQLMKRGETVMKKLRDTGVQEINEKSLKGVSGFNKGDMAPLLVEFYEITKRAMEIIPALQALEKQAITKFVKLEDKVFADGLPEALNLANVRRVIKEELTEAVPSITKEAKKETEKKWSDLFTKNQQEKPSNGSYSARIEGKKLAREIIAEEDRQRNVMIRGYNLEGLAAEDDDNVGSENRSYSYAPEAVKYLIKHLYQNQSIGRELTAPDTNCIVTSLYH